MTFQTTEQEWHSGELAMHRLMSAPTFPNPSSPFLTPSAAIYVRAAPLEAVGMLDAQNRPWTSVWAGAAGFATPVALGKADGSRASGIVVDTVVDTQYDPVVQLIRTNLERGEPSVVSGLAIDLMERKRVKWAGALVGADFKAVEGSAETARMQAVVEVESSLGNCPKYLNQIPLKTITPSPILHSSSMASSPAALPAEAIALIAAAPLFFLTTSHDGATLSTNHRGGPPGFLRLLLPENVSADAATAFFTPPENPILAYPEYSGNRLYQSLGNLHETPYLGLAVPDFRTGAILYATTHTRILAGTAAARAMARSNLVVAMELLEWKFVQHGLSATVDAAADDDWNDAIGWSPYNPPVRYLAAEQLGHGSLPTPPPEAAAGLATATLTARTVLGPGIARFAFDLDPVGAAPMPPWKAGQYVVLDFNPELSEGYSHMRDDDPASLNDDLLRTFTISSAPAPATLEITIRNVGRCTGFLFKANVRAGVELPVVAIGGDFVVEGGESAGPIGFVAGGIGITPLLAQMSDLRREGKGVRLWWGVRGNELGFVGKVVDTWLKKEGEVVSEGAGQRTLDLRLFVSGMVDAPAAALSQELEGHGVRVQRRRLQKEDLSAEAADVEVFYLCAGEGITGAVNQWLDGTSQSLVTESFNF